MHNYLLFSGSTRPYALPSSVCVYEEKNCVEEMQQEVSHAHKRENLSKKLHNRGLHVK